MLEGLGVGGTAEFDVGAAAGHVGGDRDPAELAGLADDLGLARVLARVEHVVRDALAGEQFREALADIDRDGSHQHRLADRVQLFDLADDAFELLLLAAEDQVGQIGADHRPVGRDGDDLEVVDGVELVGLGQRGAGHAGELVVEAEEVLQGDRRVGLALVLDRHALLGLDRLVQAVGPASAGQDAAGVFVDDLDLAAGDQVLFVLVEEVVRLQCVIEVVRQVHRAGVVEVVDAERLGRLVDALVAQGDVAVLDIDFKVGHRDQRFGHIVGLDVVLFAALGRARDDQRHAGLVDQHRVDLVDDGKGAAGLDLVVDRARQVVAQVIEAELVVGAVDDVPGIDLLAQRRSHLALDRAHRHTQQAQRRRIPRGVARGEVVVDGDDVHALVGQRVEVAGQRSDQGLALAGLHLGDPALVQDRRAQHLHIVCAHAEGGLRVGMAGADGGVGGGGQVDVPRHLAFGKLAAGFVDGGGGGAPGAVGEVGGGGVGGVDRVPHADAAVGGLAHQGEGLDHHRFEGGAAAHLFAQLGATRAQGAVIGLLHLGFEPPDRAYRRPQAAQYGFVRGAQHVADDIGDAVDDRHR